MIKSVLRIGDGIGERVWLRSVVKTIQNGMVNAGFPLEVDGRFGSGTKSAAKEFQFENELNPTGVFDKPSWKAIDKLLPQPDFEVVALLEKFRGDLNWVHQQEGHNGRPYWPGGVSGITLDPGLDLGHASEGLIEKIYKPLLTDKQMRALRAVYGFKGNDARDALNRSTTIKSVRISADLGAGLMHHTASPYWKGIARRFPGLTRKDTPASVQTVLLSLAYNRGILNRHLAPLEQLLKVKKWTEVAEKVGSMQQSHRLRGIRIRRRQEKLVISAELDFMAQQ